MARVYNFSPGPATLPEEVLRQASEELLDWRGTGASIMEISHRSPEFLQVAADAEEDLRKLLEIPETYAVLFLTGGATTQQAMLALNFAEPGQRADYILTGYWGQVAMKQASAYVDAYVATNNQSDGCRSIPQQSDWQLSDTAAYVHMTANETINGVQFNEIPEVDNAPLIADFSSSIASEPLDISQFGMLYACAQKNLGPVGITIVIVDSELLKRSGQPRAPIFDYRAHALQNSMSNTPPTWNWYMLGMITKWMISEGGVHKFYRRSVEKSSTLYCVIDDSDGFYRNEVAINARSRMNIPFFLHDPKLDGIFLDEAKAAGMIGLKGHRILGGMRASIYNAMPENGVRTLAIFMRDFQSRYG